ncbi:hypothetical protein [Leucobacter massiliensis]|uniref:Exo-alpha-sialidase n=1 Tax=Leucobacter massiliensis TaxID=1686285 RepID=A0A2S9QN54_9MICO|nr:hypothetical protein [Leucobacter massiliensis]PRI11018.1 hypothetical protein B4915_09100 [Leucobacter massiliensis]
MSRLLVGLLLGVLAVIAVAITILAVLATRPSPASPEAPPVPTSLQPTPDPDPTPSPTATASPASAPPQRLLSVSEDEGVLLRARIDADVVEYSSDGGASWETAPVSAVPGAAVRALDALDPTASRAVYLDADGEALVARSFVGGAQWQDDPDQSGLWLVGSSLVVGAQAPPCDAVGFAVSGARGAVLCADQRVAVSEDAGASWAEPVAVPGAAAVGLTPEGVVVASAAEPECAGVRTRTLIAGTLGDPGACLELPTLDPAQIAVAGGTGSLSLWAGDRFARSTDGGASWG